MTDRPHEREVAIAAATLAALDVQADDVREHLAKLRADLAAVQREMDRSRAEQVHEANAKLVMAVLEADTIAEAAISHLGRLAQTVQTGPPSETPHHASGAAVEADPAHAAAAEAPLRPERRIAAAAGLQSVNQDLREANEQLVMAALSAQESEAHARQLHRQQIKFMAMVAHELRNPLTPIRLAAGLLLNRDGGGTSLARLNLVIEKQVAHMTRLIDDLLDGSRISTGKLRLERTTVDLIDVIGRAADTCRPAMLARRQQMTLTLPPGPLPFHGDPVRLAQIFNNLLENASKYTPDQGRIALTATLQEGAITVTVADEGMGISAEGLTTIFGLFVQDTRALAHAQGGLGIGLAVVRDLVDAHGGTIIARSAGRDRGSEFIVTLPLVDSAVATAVTD